MKSTTIIVFIVLAHEAFAQVTLPGQCPKFKNPLEKTFKFDSFCGVWIGIQRYDFPTIFRCTRGFYRNNYNGTYNVYDTGYHINTGKPISAIFDARQFTGPNLAIRVLPHQTLDKPNFVVAGTDYKKWAAIVNCRNINETAHNIVANVFSRKYPMDPHDLEKAYAALRHAKVDLSYLIDYDQRNCKY